jgi:hypothetical protein
MVSLCGIKHNDMELMKKSLWTLLLGGAVLITGCKKEDTEEPSTPDTPDNFSVAQNGNVNTVEGTTDVNYTFTSDKTWVLKGFVYVDGGATLTIEPGTIIRGDKDTKGTLIIRRGAKIMAVGSSSQPIVFTSNQPVGQRAAGDWGGLIICGRANNNQPDHEATIEGGVDARYGGYDDNDNSGTLSYVRIEFPGIPFQPNQEINGLTLGAVGAGTTIDHIQVSYCGDDSYEWFGGNVNAKFLVAFRGLDDDFDMDNGYRGKFQFGMSLREAQTADGGGSNSLEHDNDANGTTSTPFTTPVLSNISVFGPQADPGTTVSTNYKRALHLRRNAHTRVFNSVFAGFPTGVLIDGTSCEENANNGELKVKNCVFSATATLTATASGSNWDITSWFNNSGNVSYDSNTLLGIVDGFNLGGPTPTLNGGSPLASGASFSDSELTDSFFTQVAFKGAFGTENWTSGWCNWDPQNTAY